MSPPRVTVLMPVWNGGAHLPAGALFQNTGRLRPAFPLLYYLPASCSDRLTDIWRSYE